MATSTGNMNYDKLKDFFNTLKYCSNNFESAYITQVLDFLPAGLSLIFQSFEE